MNFAHFLVGASILILTTDILVAQTAPTKPVFVIVHGAWGGGWAFKKVEGLLRESGNTVYRVTLTGQGERVHLATTDVGLITHITDVVNTILYEDLQQVVLIGHSYGGMVITGVADSIPDRIHKLVYLDGVLPENGESMNTIFSFVEEGGIKNVNGFIVAPWVRADQKPPKDVPHPYKTWSDVILLKNPLRAKIPCTYILTVDKGRKPENDDFASQAERAKQKKWLILHLEADHNPQWSAPEALVNMLLAFVNK